ncbi:DUF1488 family protein [Xanthobacter sp. AM11]|uniref:DUF1488 family protein n=1 Tax=Xanthobacter sp. AM11 TaxID=3380643 RepID=UPI0039BEE466
MPLQFPNASRVFDPVRRSVTFWGHDSAFEVAFHLDGDALKRFKFPGRTGRSGISADLRHEPATDRARRKRRLARRRQSFHRLSASDF